MAKGEQFTDIELRLTMSRDGWFELQRRLVVCESSTRHLAAFNEQMSAKLDEVMGMGSQASSGGAADGEDA